LTGTLIAFWLSALGTEAVAYRGPSLTVHPCVGVDETTVREVMELEVRGARSLPASVSVRCVDGAQEIRVEPWISPEREGIRTIRLPPVREDDDAAARQARSRELALAIAEFIRRLNTAQPSKQEPPTPEAAPAPTPTPSAPPAPSAPPSPRSVASSAPPSEIPAGCWQLGLLLAAERFSGGAALAGGDLFVSSCLGRWFAAELRAGGRIGYDEPLPNGRLTTRAADASAAVALRLWPPGHSVEAAFGLRAQGYLIRFRAQEGGESQAPTALLGALTLTAEPRLTAVLTRRLSLAASAGAGYPLHGIVVRVQGNETHGVSGPVVSASLGAVFTF
jgi:hypothetical protein